MVAVNLVPYESQANFPTQFAVVTCFLECNGQVMLLQRARQDEQEGLWGIPGGKLDKEESPRDGLKRELFEETGLETNIDDFQLLNKAYMGNPCDGSYLLYLYYLKLDTIFEAPLNVEEHSGQKWVPIKDFLKQPLLFSQGMAFEYIEEKLKSIMKESQPKKEVCYAF